METTAANEPTHRRILRMLKEHQGGYLSGALLAARLGLSRTGVWKHVRNLMALGYIIESHPKEGYRLLAVPDLLLPEEVLPDLTTRWLARSYHYFPEISSTNEYALKLAGEEAPDGAAVVAELQTQGRGRLRREWISPPKCGIYISFLMRKPLPLMEASHATSVAALALVETLREKRSLSAQIKWPNDVLLNGRKISGILTEMQSDQDFTKFLVIGIGINVNHSQEDFQGAMRYPATSVAIETGSRSSRQELLLDYLQRLEILYDEFLEEGFPALAPKMEQASAILGKNITIHRGKEEISGRALRFSRQGALVILTEESREELIWVGDVTRVEGGF